MSYVNQQAITVRVAYAHIRAQLRSFQDISTHSH